MVKKFYQQFEETFYKFFQNFPSNFVNKAFRKIMVNLKEILDKVLQILKNFEMILWKYRRYVNVRWIIIL